MTDQPAIVMENVSFSYGGPPVVEDVNLRIEPRQFVSVVGPNGGGKTTLLRLILGLLKPDSGSVRVLGTSPVEARGRVGYVPQSAELDSHFPISVRDVVLMGRLGVHRRLGPYDRADRSIADAALDEMKLADLRRRSFASLSGGQRQRALIARALACRPDILLLDEPTASLDIAVEGELYALLTALSDRLTIVLVSHDLGFVSRFVESVICVKRRVVVHPTSELTGEIIREVYGADVRMVRHDHDHHERGGL